MMPAKKAHDIRNDFPALAGDVCFLDSAASAQKPRSVIDAMAHVMETHYANVHRGVYDFSARTSVAYEEARKKVSAFINAKSEKEIIFTRNATEAINLVAATWGVANLAEGDEVILTELEHHANIVPWTMLKEQKGIVIRVVPITPEGALDMAAYERFLTSGKVKLVAVTQMSNALGTVTPIADMVAKAKAAGAVTLVDGSQGIVHLSADMQKIGCDFYVFTGHKLYGPTGMGVLYGRYDLLDAMPPYQGGGEMIERVTFDGCTYKEPPYRFEAGTPAIVEAIGLGAAVDYVCGLDFDAVMAEEARILSAAEQVLADIKGVVIHSRATERAAILSFSLGNVHPHDVGTILDQCGVAVRAGHHCAQPLMKALGVTATVRASFSVYNTMDDVTRLAEGLEKAQRIFKS